MRNVISVSIIDAVVVVDGLARVVQLPTVDPNWRALQWSDPRGVIEVKTGDPIQLTTEEFRVLEPFHAAWLDAGRPVPVELVDAPPGPVRAALGVRRL